MEVEASGFLWPITVFLTRSRALSLPFCFPASFLPHLLAKPTQPSPTALDPFLSHFGCCSKKLSGTIPGVPCRAIQPVLRSPVCMGRPPSLCSRMLQENQVTGCDLRIPRPASVIFFSTILLLTNLTVVSSKPAHAQRFLGASLSPHPHLLSLPFMKILTLIGSRSSHGHSVVSSL